MGIMLPAIRMELHQTACACWCKEAKVTAQSTSQFRPRLPNTPDNQANMFPVSADARRLLSLIDFLRPEHIK